MLGIVTDNPAYINLLLSFGVVGRTGKDLNLDVDLPDEKPLLYSLSGSSSEASYGNLKGEQYTQTPLTME